MTSNTPQTAEAEGLIFEKRAAWRSSRLLYMALGGAGIAVLLLLLWSNSVFMSSRLRLNDLYYSPAPTTGNIVIIAADDASLSRYGRTPADWPRTVYADLADVLAQSQARVLAIDLLLSESDVVDATVAAAFSRLRQSDARTRIVLADAGVNQLAATDMTVRALPFSAHLDITPVLAEVIDYRGYTNAIPDIDSLIRRYPSLIEVDGEVQYSFSLAAYLSYLRIPASAADQLVVADGAYLMVTPERRIPVDQWGLWQPYYYSPPATLNSGAFEVISLVDVLDGAVEPSRFDGKIVLLGLMNTTGGLDQYLVPSSTAGQLMAGVEIQANALENLLQSSGKFIRPLDVPIQGVLIVLLTLAASLLYALPRWYVKLAIALVLSVGWLIITSLVFSSSYVMISLFDTLLALGLPALVSIGIDITLETQRRRQTEFLLVSLQQIAAQRLNLAQAAEYILSDVEKIAPKSAAALFIAGGSGRDEWVRYRLGQVPDRSSSTKALLEGLKPLPDVTHFPLIWQGVEQGSLVLSNTLTKLDGTRRELVEQLVESVSPNIDNMLLYEDVERQKTLLDSVFAESPAGIAILDGNGTVVQCNQDLARLMEMNQRDIQGKSLPELLSLKSNKEEMQGQIKGGLDSRTLYTLEELKLGGNYVRVLIAPLKAYALSIVVVSDITPLVDLSNLKTRMLRIASHDLKNPLARIKGFVELVLLFNPNMDEKTRQYVKYIQEAGDEMLRIIEDILNLERMRSGKPMLSDINLAHMVREVCARNQPDLLHKQQTMSIDISTETIPMRADAAQLSQAVNNFVGNAIKYTPDGGMVKVRLHTDGQTIRFEVEDTGYGIPAKAQPKIFSEFYRAKADGTLHIPGTGLGLSLVKAVIEAHGGSVGFNSIEGQGSTFYFTLPDKG